MSGGDAYKSAVVVVSDRSLVADAVAAALAGSGDLAVVRLSWPAPVLDPEPGWPPEQVRPDLGLLICDLATSASARVARRVIRDYPTRWLLLTDTAEGPHWGAMLELGVVGILASSTGLSALLAVIESIRGGAPGPLPADREALVAAWRREEAEREHVHAQLSALTAREAEVLRLLHLGRTVHEIAELRGVAHSTVRSQVRSVLRKLGVSSQLAAAAVLDKWGDPKAR